MTMSLQQVGQLLTLVALNDNRAWTPETAMSWHAILGDLDYDAAVTAMYTHFRDSDEYLMPAHIVAGVLRARQAELPGTMSPGARETCPDGEHRWLSDGTCMLCLRRRDREPIRGGGAPKPANYDAMVKAARAHDSVQWVVETSKYNQQLADAGLPPVSIPRLSGLVHDEHHE